MSTFLQENKLKKIRNERINFVNKFNFIIYSILGKYF